MSAILVGPKKAIGLAVQQVKDQQRYTPEKTESLVERAFSNRGPKTTRAMPVFYAGKPGFVKLARIYPPSIIIWGTQ